jgi:hypothetical protein
LYSLVSIIRISRQIEGAGHVVCMEAIRNAYKILNCKPERKMLAYMGR